MFPFSSMGKATKQEKWQQFTQQVYDFTDSKENIISDKLSRVS